MISLGERHREPELMDDPQIDPTLHKQALIGLRRLNWISRTVPVLWNPIRQLAAANKSPALRVLDVACGGGDVAIELARSARRSGLQIEVSGCDLSPTAVEHAKRNAEARGEAVDFFQADAIGQPLRHDFDVICASLFLHHLDEEDAVRLLSSMRQSARRMILISDLVRSRLGYVLCWCGVRLMTRCHVCHVDGPLSVRAAFTPDEALQLCQRAALSDVQLTRHWPQRFVLKWKRP